MSEMSNKGWLVVVPTFNEAENILPLIDGILKADPLLEVLVVDDDSPDGTFRLVEDAGKKDPRVHLLHRTRDRGRGRSGAAGFAYALTQGYRGAVEMDADFSHDPRHLPELLFKIDEGFDLVLGSRTVPGGQDLGRPFWRILVTKAANAYIRLILGLKVRDCNSGYRAWTRQALERSRAAFAQSRGPAIVQELLYRAHKVGLKIAEVPIRFVERERGESTLTLRTLFRGYWTVLKLRFSPWKPEIPWEREPRSRAGEPKDESERREVS
jgi:dolichol-phosphate mannosyltransferase